MARFSGVGGEEAKSSSLSYDMLARNEDSSRKSFASTTKTACKLAYASHVDVSI